MLLPQLNKARHRQTTPAHIISAYGNQTGQEASKAGNRHVHEGAEAAIEPRDGLSAKEIWVATSRVAGPPNQRHRRDFLNQRAGGEELPANRRQARSLDRA